MTVSVEARPAPAKATGVSHHRATWPAPLFVPTTTMCPKRRPPRPKHPDFAHFHRGGPQFGRITPQHRAIGGRRRDLPRCRWAVAGPGRASRRRAERSSRRGRLAGGPPPTGTPSSPAPHASQRLEIWRGAKQKSGGPQENLGTTTHSFTCVNRRVDTQSERLIQLFVSFSRSAARASSEARVPSLSTGVE